MRRLAIRRQGLVGQGAQSGGAVNPWTPPNTATKRNQPHQYGGGKRFPGKLTYIGKWNGQGGSGREGQDRDIGHRGAWPGQGTLHGFSATTVPSPTWRTPQTGAVYVVGPTVDVAGGAEPDASSVC